MMVLQVLIQVTDGGIPPLSDFTIMQITIERNLESPRFLHNPVNVRILDTIVPGSFVVQVNATDDDAFVSNSCFWYYIYRIDIGK